MPEFTNPQYRSLISVVLIAMISASCAFRCAREPAQSTEKSNSRSAHLIVPAAACIDGARAIAHIKKIISFGPRHPGTKGAEKTREYIMKTLADLGLHPKRSDFLAYTPHPALKEVSMANITVDIAGSTDAKKILIGGHFDGKIIDGGVFAGANDGGSSTGLLLEIARCLAKHQSTVSVRLAFFDGEEALVKWSDSDSLYGSKRMASELRNTGKDKSFAAMVNVDMIGDKRLLLQREHLSTPWVLASIEETSVRLGYLDLFEKNPTEIGDDHVPFLNIGIPAVNLIDLRFGPGWKSNEYWHTPQDSLDKLSPKSIETIGKIVIDSLATLSRGKPTSFK